MAYVGLSEAAAIAGVTRSGFRSWIDRRFASDEEWSGATGKGRHATYSLDLVRRIGLAEKLHVALGMSKGHAYSMALRVLRDGRAEVNTSGITVVVTANGVLQRGLEPR